MKSIINAIHKSRKQNGEHLSHGPGCISVDTVGFLPILATEGWLAGNTFTGANANCHFPYLHLVFALVIAIGQIPKVDQIKVTFLSLVGFHLLEDT